MVDCVMPVANAEFVKAEASDRNEEYSLGIKGLWLVGSSRDYFTAFENDQYIGYEIDNCCGSQTVVIAK